MAEAPPESLDALAARYRPVDTGFSSRILRSGTRCLRLPRSAAAARRCRTETRLLDVIGDRLPVEVPALTRSLEPTARHPHGGQLLNWLEGREVDATVDPGSIAAFLTALHGLDPAPAAPLLPAFSDWCRRQRTLERRGLRLVAQHLDPGLAGPLRETTTRLGDRIETACRRPRLVHGDLWYGNLLMRDGRLTGVLDWEYAALADPMVDYAALWYLGEDFMARVLARLGRTLDDLPETLTYYRLLRELHGLVWSADNDDADELADSLAKVTAVARSVPSRNR